MELAPTDLFGLSLPAGGLTEYWHARKGLYQRLMQRLDKGQVMRRIGDACACPYRSWVNTDPSFNTYTPQYSAVGPTRYTNTIYRWPKRHTVQWRHGSDLTAVWRTYCHVPCQNALFIFSKSTC